MELRLKPSEGTSEVIIRLDDYMEICIVDDHDDTKVFNSALFNKKDARILLSFLNAHVYGKED